MADAVPIRTSNSVTYQAPPAPVPGSEGSGLSFREILSDLNPLQYLPVVGTLYRAVTGDTISRPLREAGSLVVSGLMGGPVGIATNLAMLGFEKVTGIDLEEVEQNVLASLGQQGALSAPLLQSAAVEGAGAASVSGAAAPTKLAQSAPASSGDPAGAVPWTNAQLAAYGVVKSADGELHQGALSGADVLNALQLRTDAG